MKKVKRFLPVGLWMLFIFFGSSLPAVEVSENSLVNFLAHKLVHLLEYSVLCLLIYRSRVGNLSSFRIKSGLGSLVLTVIYGATDEFHQLFVPGREPRLRDVGIDFLGGMIGIITLWKLSRAAPSSPSSSRKKSADR